MTKDYTPKNTDFVWNGDESKHTEARKMLARKVREKFGTIGDWYTIKGLPTDHDDDVEKVCLEILTMYRERRNSGYADILWDTDEFWTEEWLIRWFSEQKQKVYDILEHGRRRHENRQKRHFGPLRPPEIPLSAQ